MSETLSWIFELADRVSDPASEIAKKMSLAEKAMVASASASAHLARGLEHSGQAARHAGEEHGGFVHRLHDLVEVAYELPQILGEVFEKAKEFGHEIVGEMAFKQNTLIALEALKGTRAEAIAIFEDVEDFAYKTGSSVRDAMSLTKDLVASGFNTGEIETMRLLLGDMRIVDPAKASEVAVALGEIGRRGEMTERQIRSLSNAGIDMTLFFKGLAQTTGMSEAALRSMEGLKIAKGTALDLIAQIMLGKYSGGEAGSQIARQMGTIPGALDRVAQIPERIIDELSGMEAGRGGALAHILTNLADAFDPKSATGEHIISNVRDLVADIGALFGLSGGSGLFAELAGPNGPKRIEEAFVGAIAWVRTIAIPAVVEFAHSVSTIAAELRALSDVGREVDRVLYSTAMAGRWWGGGAGNGPSARTQREQEAVADIQARLPLFQQPEQVGKGTVLAPQYSVTVNIAGDASEEDVRTGVKRGLEDVHGAANAHEEHALEAGAM